MAANPNPALPEPSGVRTFVRALRHRNFRLYFSGQCVSLVGTWIQQIAMGWTVYQLTHSGLLLGVVGFAGQLPVFLVAPLAGVLVDRHSRHRILLTTQSLAMLHALALASLAFSNHLNVWNIIALNVLAGINIAVDLPTRQSFLVEMVGNGPDLQNAVALNSLTVNGSRMLEPAIAGLLLAAVTPAVCFLVNGLSFIAVLAALLAMNLHPHERRVNEGKRAHHELLEGIRYAFAFLPIRTLLMLVALMSLAGMSYSVLMPIFAAEIFHGGAHTLGFLMVAPGVGALAAALYLVSRKTILGSGNRIAIGAVAFGAGLAVFSVSRWLPLSFAALMVAGWGIIVQLALCNTILQTIVDDDKRGRVMSLYTMAFMGFAPFGSMLMGALSSRFGAPQAVFCGGVACVVGGLYFATRLPALRPFIVPIYRRKGIIPELARGLQAAAECTRSPED